MNKLIEKCQNCGMQLKSDERSCPLCGAKAKHIKFKGTPQRKKSSPNYKQILSIAVFVLLIAARLIMFNLPEDNELTVTETRRVTSLNGCPEFFDVEWKMSVDEVASLLGTGYRIEEDETPTGKECLSLVPNATFEYLGIESVYTFAQFAKTENDGSRSLSSVSMFFSDDDISFNELKGKITQVYGEDGPENMWVGPNTIILLEDCENGEFCVAYIYSYNMMVLDYPSYGPDIDPLGLAGENNVLGKSLSVYVAGIENDEPEITRTENGTYCTLYSGIRYVTAPRPSTYVRLTADPSDKITAAEYIFTLDYSNPSSVTSLIGEIEDNLRELYGENFICRYGSIGIPGSDGQITLDELNSSIEEKRHGDYSIVWNPLDANVLLNIRIDTSNNHYTGSVTFRKGCPPTP